MLPTKRAGDEAGDGEAKHKRQEIIMHACHRFLWREDNNTWIDFPIVGLHAHDEETYFAALEDHRLHYPGPWPPRYLPDHQAIHELPHTRTIPDNLPDFTPFPRGGLDGPLVALRPTDHAEARFLKRDGSIFHNPYPPIPVNNKYLPLYGVSTQLFEKPANHFDYLYIVPYITIAPHDATTPGEIVHNFVGISERFLRAAPHDVVQLRTNVRTRLLALPDIGLQYQNMNGPFSAAEAKIARVIQHYGTAAVLNRIMDTVAANAGDYPSFGTVHEIRVFVEQEILRHLIYFLSVEHNERIFQDYFPPG